MPVLSEAAHAQRRKEEGRRVVLAHGRHFEAVRPGFFQALHWLARLAPAEAGRPHPLCWGYRATLAAPDGANAALPVHLLADLAAHDPALLPPKRRAKLRKSARLVRVVAVRAPDLLHAQGHAVRLAVARRLGIWQPPPIEAYRAGLAFYLAHPGRLVLAGLHDGRLGGYLDATAIDGTAYIDHVHLHDDALTSEVGTALVFALIAACRRAGAVREIVYGLETPEAPGLGVYKSAIGFPVVRVPARLWLLPPAGALIRRLRPAAWYRLSGGAVAPPS